MKTTARNFEVLVQETYEAILRDGDIAIDIGAHHGRHSIAMAERVFPNGKVLAFEPLPMCREILSQEIADYYPELARVIHIYPYALTDFAGETEFVVAKDALAYSGLKERKYDWPTALGRIPIQARRLDDLCLDLPSLRYIKIDAEGGEYHILKGGVQTLGKFRPVVVFEFGVSSIAEYRITPVEMARFWIVQAYKLYDILGNCLTDKGFITSAHAQQVWDYVALPAENRILEKIIVGVLTRPPAWHLLTTHLDMAEHTAHVGEAMPRLTGFRGVKRWLARLAARLVIRGTQVITRPQRVYNRSVLRCLRALIHILRKGEDASARQANGAADLQEAVGELSRWVPSLEQLDHGTPDGSANTPSERAMLIMKLERMLAQLKDGLAGEGDADRAA